MMVTMLVRRLVAAALFVAAAALLASCGVNNLWKELASLHGTKKPVNWHGAGEAVIMLKAAARSRVESYGGARHLLSPDALEIGSAASFYGALPDIRVPASQFENCRKIVWGPAEFDVALTVRGSGIAIVLKGEEATSLNWCGALDIPIS